MGTPQWAVPALEELAARSDIEIRAVVTNPDKPVGRAGQRQPTPVKAAAERHGLAVYQPERARDGELASILRAAEADAAVVVAYGKILPPDVLEIPRLGFVNLHFSLLPAYRGAAPVQRALMDGVTTTGVSVMVLTEGMDEGPVLARKQVAVDPDETAGELGPRLAEEGAPLLADALTAFVSGSLVPEPQDESAASYAAKISTDDARIDWAAPAERVHNLVRATHPEPGAWTHLREDRIKILRTTLDPTRTLPPGAPSVTKRGLWVGTGSTAVEILQGQRAGSRPMSGAELARGLHMTPEDRFV